jgi:Domain of unknown function (DUF4440)
MLRHFVLYAIFAGLISLSGCAVYAEHPAKAIDDATGGEGFERAFWQDIQKQNWKDLNSHIASNFVYVTPNGRYERADALQRFEQFQLQEFSIGDLISEMNRDTFVVTYTIVLRGTRAGQTLNGQPERRMTVWQQQKRGWVAIAHSIVGPELR